MRLLMISMLLILAEAGAEACPRGTACVAAGTRAAVETPVKAPAIPLEVPSLRPHTLFDHAISAARQPRSRDPLAHSLATHVVAKPNENAMPWVWDMLRRSVYARMPSYEHRGARPDRVFSMTLSPVVVDSPSDSVPGVGIEGGF